MEAMKIRVASNSNVKSVAGSITKSFEEGKQVEVIAIGAGAVNQAIKSLAMSRGFLSMKGRDLYFAPGFTSVEIDGQVRTAMKFVLKVL